MCVFFFQFTKRVSRKKEYKFIPLCKCTTAASIKTDAAVVVMRDDFGSAQSVPVLNLLFVL